MLTFFQNRAISSSDPSFSALPGTNRRQILGTIGLAGLGLLATSTPASAFRTPQSSSQPRVNTGSGTRNSSPGQHVDVSGLPSEWVTLQGSNLHAYSQYLASLKLKRLTPMQVISAHAKKRGSVWNSLPPRAWWNRMGYTLRVVDRIAVELRSPVDEILSAYRSPAYNARCAGASKGSWHQANVAVDVKFPIRPSVVTATSRNLRDRGLFKGGVGSYRNFTHIDTRGANINW